MRLLILVLAVLAVPAFPIPGFPPSPSAPLAVQQTSGGLTIDSIIAMAKAGLSESLIIGRIRKNGKAFDLSPDDMIKLKNGGVSNAILEVMLDPSAGGAAKPSGAPAAPATPAPAASEAKPPAAAESGEYRAGAPPFPEMGVYYKKAEQWTELLPEIVNWKTGGVIKGLATAGIVKKDVNGNIPGAHSRNSATFPAEFMIYAPEGVAITEYQLIRLRAKDDYREFRTITGGVFNQRSGAMRDMVPFEGKKVSPRLFSVQLPEGLGAGDYGFILPLGTSGSTGSASAVGKMYTFRVVE